MTIKRSDDEEILQILHLRSTTDLSADEIGRQVGRSRSAILGIEKRIRDAEIPCACSKPENMDGSMSPMWWAS